MKKITLIILGLFIVAVIIFLSCRKDPSKTNNITNSSKIIKLKSYWINPYDTIGQQHNEVLYAIGNMYGFPFITSTSIGEFGLNYLDSINNDSKDHELSYYDGIYDNMDKNQSLEDYANDLLNANKITTYQFNYLSNLNDIIVSYIENNTYFNDHINDLETTLLSDTNILQNDKYVIWGALSIARYSGNFWHDARISDSNPWHVIVAQTKKEIRQEYTGSACGEAWADTKGWIGGLFGTCTGKRGHCAKAAGQRASGRYVRDHTHCYDENDNEVPCPPES